jgi:membrane protein
MKSIKNKLDFLIRFLKHDIWHQSLDKLPKTKSFLIKNLRIVVLAFRGFNEDECRLRASAMTYYSLMLIVPVFALAFAIAKGFGLDKILETLIYENFSENQAIINKLLVFANTLLNEARGGVIAGIGTIVLIWAIVEILSHIEHSFNAIWHVRESRSLLRKIPEYLTLAILAPVFIIVSSSVAAFLSSQFNSISNENSLIEYIGPFFKFFFNLAPYFLTWVVFTTIYVIIPNTRVKFKPALLAGFIAGTAFQLTQMGYFIVQIELIDINAIYGSFAAIPLLMVWLRMSWIIIMFGAELTYAIQNIKKYEYDLDVSNMSYYSQKIISLLIMHTIIKRFVKEEQQPTASELSSTIKIPLKLVRQIVYELIQCRLITEVKTSSDKEYAYIPAFDVLKISIQTVIERLDKKGNNDICNIELPACKEMHARINSFNETLKAHSANKLVKEID